MPRIQLAALLAFTLAFLPACDPPDEPDASVSGPNDFADDPDEPGDPDSESEGEPDPPHEPQRLDRLSDAPRGQDTGPESPDHLEGRRGE